MQSGSAAACKGSNPQGAGKSTTQKSADGTVSHQGAPEASGKNGSVQSGGSVRKHANGKVNGQRTKKATGKNGNSYQGAITDTNGGDRSRRDLRRRKR